MAATNTTNLRQYALNSEEQIRKRYQDLLMQKYGMGNFDVNKAYTEQTGQALSGWTDIDEKRAAIEYERYLNDIQQAQKLGFKLVFIFFQEKTKYKIDRAFKYSRRALYLGSKSRKFYGWNIDLFSTGQKDKKRSLFFCKRETFPKRNT